MEKIGIITDPVLTALVIECQNIWENDYECIRDLEGAGWDLGLWNLIERHKQ